MMGGFAERLVALRQRIARACDAAARDPAAIELLAVSKTRSIAELRTALAAGQIIFGENRVQELVEKAAALAATQARWHMIGSLQTNKVRALCELPGLVLLHCVDRPKLVAKLAEVCAELPRAIDVLLQVNATGEAQKHGARPDELAALARDVLAQAPRLRLVGLMGMGPRAGEPRQVFTRIAALRSELQDRLGLPLPVLSLGMSADLEPAIAAGSTLLRIGSDLFGERRDPADRR